MTQVFQGVSGREFFKKAALQDRQFFHEYYLDRERKLAWHQLEMYDFIDKVSATTRHGVILEPRGHTKSTIVAIDFVVQQICRNPNVRILIAQKAADQAKKTVEAIKTTLRLKGIREDFNHRIMLKGPRSFMLQRETVSKDWTVEGIGVGNSSTGGHFDFIICDDIVDVENSSTPGERQRLKAWFEGTLMYLVEPHTTIIYIATRKNYADLTGDLLKNKSWTVLVRKAIIKMPDKYEYVFDEEGSLVGVNVMSESQVLFPEKWPIEALLMDKYRSGSIIFNREMQNEVIADEDASFKMSWLRYYHREGEPAGVNTEVFPRVWKKRFTGVDLAISQSETSDYFVRVSIVVDHLQRVFIEPYDHLRVEFPEQAAILKAHMMSQKPWKCGVESNQYQLALVQHLNRELLRPVIPVKHSTKKTERIIGTLSPLFEAGKIFIHESMGEFIEQYAQFPKAKHDDIMDALEIAVSMALDSQQQISGKMRMRLIG